MRLHFLGAGGSVVTPRRHTTGLYLPEFGILLDAGSNVFPLRELHGDRPLHVLMSHWHLDHSLGLFFLSAALFHGLPEPEIRVWGSTWSDRFRALCGEESPLWPIALPFPIEEAPQQFRLSTPAGEVEVFTHAVPHNGPCIAYRLHFPNGERLAYVTDTTAPGEYAEFIQGVDALVHECSFPAGFDELAQITGHSTADQVGRVAAKAGVKALYLTHVGPLSDGMELLEQVREHYPEAVLPAEGLDYPRPVSVDPKTAVFPGSFDPLTIGHLDIIHSCLRMFSSLHVVVARNPAKDRTALFTPEERAELIRQCVPSTVRVSAWDGLSVDYADKVHAGCMVRGLGRAEDYFGEVRLYKTNALLHPEIQTVWVPPHAENLDVSSSVVKEAARFGGWERVSRLVPEPIREAVGQRVAERREAS